MMHASGSDFGTASLLGTRVAGKHCLAPVHALSAMRFSRAYQQTHSEVCALSVYHGNSEQEPSTQASKAQGLTLQAPVAFHF